MFEWMCEKKRWCGSRDSNLNTQYKRLIRLLLKVCHGRIGDFRYPDPPCTGIEHRGTRLCEDGGETTIGTLEGVASSRLAKASSSPSTGRGRYQRLARYRLPRACSTDLLYLLYLRGTLRLYRRCVVKPEVSGKEARVLAKFHRLQGRADAKYQSILLLAAQKMARRKAV
jgi:hypothetical protein